MPGDPRTRVSSTSVTPALAVTVLLATACSGGKTDRVVASKQPAAGSTPVVQTIDWSAVRQHPQLPAGLRDRVPERIRALPLPVLLPPQEQWLADARLTSGPRWYAASLRLDRHSVYVSGNGVALRARALPPRSMPGLRVTSGEGILSATWQQFGATYLVNVECDEPLRDPRCTDQGYVRRLVQTLVVAGGEP
jgi:hypothetical protein